MKLKSVVLLGLLLIVLAIVCSSGSQRAWQQETILTDTQSGLLTTEESSELVDIESEPVTEVTEASEESVEETTMETESSEETLAIEIMEIPYEQETEAGETAQESAEPDDGKFKIISEELGLEVDYIEIDFENVQNAYELLFVNDMHVLELDDSVVPESVENVKVRRDASFRTRTGMASAAAWPKLASVLDEFSADGIIFGGDMMDFVSPVNVEILSQGLSQITTPYIYLRADHDLGTWHAGGALSMDDSMAMHAPISDYYDMFVMEYPEFYVLGWNNSTSQLTDYGLQVARQVCKKGKPIILATHVPINSYMDNSLADAAANADHENRKKLWGADCLYRPNHNTSTFLDMIYDEKSPIKVVLSGHLHFKHVVQLTEQTVEYVLAPAFEGNIAKIVIK